MTNTGWTDHEASDAVTADRAVMVLDACGRVTNWTAAAERMTGRSADEVVGVHGSALFPDAEDGSSLDDLMGQAALSDSGMATRMARGHVLTVSALRGGGGLCGFALCVEVSPLDAYRQAFATCGEAHVLVDTESCRVVDANAKAASLFGRTVVTMRGSRFDALSGIQPSTLVAACADLRPGAIRRLRLDTVLGEQDLTLAPISPYDCGLVALTLRDACESPETTALKADYRRLAHLAHYDSLTGLANRHYFTDYLGKAVARARRRREKLAVLFIDLDNFKPVNDSLGHEAGDMLLAEIARRLQRCTRASDLVARYGGDEFIVVLEDLEDQDAAVEIATKIAASIAVPVLLSGRRAVVAASIGIACYPEGADTVQGLIRAADKAMYEAKRTRRRSRAAATGRSGPRRPQGPTGGSLDRGTRGERHGRHRS
ncbi:MAG: diguanylate cyclase [Alphaproteobacteria bacterium]